MEKILDKIRKLSRLSESTNPHEAALAIEMMTKLMQEYQITEAMVNINPEDNDPIFKDNLLHESEGRNFQNWAIWIASAICKSVGVKLWLATGNRYGAKACMKMIGRKSDSETAVYLYHAVYNQVKALCDLGWNLNGKYSGEHGKTWKNSFYIGAATVISDRLRKQKQDMMQNLNADSSKSTALVVINRRENEIQKMADEFLGGRKHQMSTSVRSNSGYNSGKEAGGRVNLGNSAGALGKPSKMIGR